ncbi:MAG: glycosyltransferase family 39 protein, partial [Actinomycetia bacterium]|nr:glycosyltransferase family 39 protein [Actinomycetes bacterium]
MSVTQAGSAPVIVASPATASLGRGGPTWVSAPVEALRRHGPLLGVVAIGAVVRLWALEEVGFNSDEAVYAGQAAHLAGDPVLSELFPLFRAHPMLFHSALSLIHMFGGGDVAARAFVAVLGVATLVVVFELGRVLYDRRVGLVAAMLLAVMPYHVGVSRLVLLDAPMVFLATATLLALARFVIARSPRLLLIAGLLLGLTQLSKMSWLFLCGLWPLLGLAWQASGGRQPPETSRKRQLPQLA